MGVQQSGISTMRQCNLLRALRYWGGAVRLGPAPEPGSFWGAVEEALEPPAPLMINGQECPVVIAGMPGPGIGIVRAGARGEAAVRSLEDVGLKGRFTVGRRDRISDGSTALTVNEIKNARYVALTRQ